MKEICDYNKFSEKIGNEELSVDCIVEMFINTTNYIAKDLSTKKKSEKQCLECPTK